MKILWHMMTKCTHFFPVSVEYPFFIAPSLRLSSSCVLCCQFFWNVNFWLPLRFVYLRLVYPMLPVSLDFPFLIAPSFCLSSSCVPYVVSCFGVSIFDCPFVSFIFIWLPIFLECPFFLLPLRYSLTFIYARRKNTCILYTLLNVDYT